MDVNELLLVGIMAVVWWIPTFIALAELQSRERVRRVLVWKWYGKLAVPIWGWIQYFRHGRTELDTDYAEQRRLRPGVAHKRSREPGGARGGGRTGPAARADGRSNRSKG